jgi:PAS domain S-box-containing protein
MSSHEQDQKLDSLLDAVDFAGVGTWDWDFASDRVRWNRSMAVLFGGDVGKLDLSAAESFAAVFSEDLPQMQERIAVCTRERTSFAMDFRVARTDGSVRWLRSNGKAIYDTAGKAISLVGITFDDTERVGLEHRLDDMIDERDALLASERTARESAERADRMKDEFLATLSHELRTPLNAVLGWAQILRLKITDATDDVRRGLEAIERNARLQTQLIDDLLDMSRIISGKVRLDPQIVTPIEAIEAAIETLLPTATTKGVRIDKTLSADAGPISADPSRLQQIVWNLLSNAVKFTPRGGTVQVLLSRGADTVTIDVTDNGIGIAPDFIDHVFERFRQADASTSRSHSGLGLGLAIVKQLVDLHGGTVRATSPGHGLGTTMSITLPLLRAASGSLVASSAPA